MERIKEATDFSCLLRISKNTLKGFYGTLKEADENLKFVFLTGVTKFSKVSIFSDLNQLNDISMSPLYAGICGITEEELEKQFSEEIEVLGNEYSYTHEECIDELKKNYDGYHFSSEKLSHWFSFRYYVECRDSHYT